jgi:predicted RND superfamily exporter protein
LSRFHQFGSFLVKALIRGAWPVIIFSLLLTAFSIYYSLNNLSMRTSRNDLVGTNLRIMQLSENMDRQFGGRDNLAVVVENSDPKDAVRFVEALAAELKQYPQHFQELFYRVDPEKFRNWAFLYLEPEQLLDLKEKLSDHQTELRALTSDPRLVRFYQVVNEELTKAMMENLFTGFLLEEQEKEKFLILGCFKAV